MALFSLTDIKIKEQKVRKSLSGNRFDSDTVRFPLDIGDVDKGHYVVFNIFVSQFIQQNYKCSPTASTNLPQNLPGVSVGGLYDSAVKYASGVLGEKTSEKIDGFVQGISDKTRNILQQSQAGRVAVQIGNIAEQQVRSAESGDLTGARVANKVKRISDNIILYMPNTLNFNQNQRYDDITRNDTLTNLYLAGKQISGGMNNIDNIVPFIAGAIKTAGFLGNSGTAQAVFARNFGILNPRAELLYSRPQFRNFSFEFMLYPRSEKEALEVQKIINKFNHHSVPSLKTGSMGQFLVPPAEFGISFYYNGMENPNIPKIKQCVLESINADYAPNGFHAYESASDVYPALGGTGMPIAIRLTMQFRELEMLTTEDYPDKDYGSRDME